MKSPLSGSESESVVIIGRFRESMGGGRDRSGEEAMVASIEGARATVSVTGCVTNALSQLAPV